MLHIKKFIDKMTVIESRMNKDVVLSIQDARGLRDDISKLLIELRELSSDSEKNEVLDVQIKGISF